MPLGVLFTKQRPAQLYHGQGREREHDNGDETIRNLHRVLRAPRFAQLHGVHGVHEGPMPDSDDARGLQMRTQGTPDRGQAGRFTNVDLLPPMPRPDQAA